MQPRQEGARDWTGAGTSDGHGRVLANRPGRRLQLTVLGEDGQSFSEMETQKRVQVGGEKGGRSSGVMLLVGFPGRDVCLVGDQRLGSSGWETLIWVSSLRLILMCQNYSINSI